MGAIKSLVLARRVWSTCLICLVQHSLKPASVIMAANTSSYRHPLQHEVLVSPISDEMNHPPEFSAEIKSKTLNTTVTRVSSWPEEARQLKKHDWATVLFALGDVILVFMPIYFVRMCFPFLYPYVFSS